jgi:hypothetical protein
MAACRAGYPQILRLAGMGNETFLIENIILPPSACAPTNAAPGFSPNSEVEMIFKI